MKKRIISLLLIMIMVLGIFTGCGKKTSGGDGKLTVGVPQDMTVLDYDTNALTVWLEEQSGLDIEFVYYAGVAANYKQQLTLSASTNEELPDVLLGFNGFTHYEVNQFGEDGYFIDLSELIEEHAPNYKKAIAGLSEEKQKYIKEKAVNTVDGKSIYAMPSLEMEYADNLQSMVYINQEWLDKFGLQKPTTVAEFEAVCDAFANKDPNGNGQKDEIAILGSEFVPWLMNAYVEYPNSAYNVDANGKVWDPLETEEFRQGMAWITSLVKKGYFSELGFTLARNDYKNMVSETDGTAKVGMFVGHHETNILSGYDDVMKKFTALGPLADVTGKGGYTIVRETEPTWGAAITADCEDPVAAMKFLDIFYTDEAVTRQRWGEKGVDWEEKEGTTVQGTKSYVHPLDSRAFLDKTTNKTLGNLLYIMTDNNYLSIVDENDTNERNKESNRLQKEQWDIMQAAKERKAVANLVYTTEEYDIREEKSNAVATYVNEQVRIFAFGEQDITDDAVWNKFQADLKSQGRDELLKIAQDAMDRKAK